MKYVLLIVVAFAASLFMWSCSSTTTTPAQSSVTIITDTVALNAGCFLPPVDDTVYIAQTDSTYLAWRAFRETRGACANAELPVVDFSKRCVVFFNMTTGSNVDYFITVSRNDDTKKINVLVQYIQYGSNTDPASKRGMYSIPRIPDGYILETKTEWLGIHDGRQSVTEILQSGTTEDLYDVVVVDTTTAYVVGANGTIRKSIDKGRTWIAQQSGVTTTLRGVWACSPLNVYAVGDRGVLLRTRNGGTTWERMTNPVGGGEFRDVRMYRDSAGVAVGRIQTEDGVRGLILHTSDGGTTWRNYVPPAGMTLPLLNCLAANQDPTLFSSVGNKSMGMYASGMRANGATSNIISSPDYGATWNLWSNGISGEISSIGLSSNIIFFGSGNEIWERDDINSSSNNQKLLQSKLYPNSVTNSIRAAHGNIASYHGPTIVGENGLIMETFIGIGWYSIPTTINHDFNGIHSIVIGNTIGTFYRLAVGNRGTIVKITKSQERWRP